MASYPIPNPQYGIYNPNNFSRQSSSTDALTVDTGKLYFLQFPNAQTTQTEFLHSIGVASDATFNGPVVFNETVTYNSDIDFLANVTVEGTATVMDNLLCETTATVTDILTCESGIDISVSGGITFPDNTTQTTAFIEANYAQLNTDNTFLAPYIQTFQQNNSTTSSTASLQINNIQNSDNVAFYIDPSAGNDLTLYSSQSAGGLTVRNPTASFTLNPIVISPGIVGAQSINPIDMNAQNITGIGALAGNGGNITCNSNLLIGASNNINMQDNDIIGLNNLTVTSGQTLSIKDGAAIMLTLNSTSGINMFENLGMNGSQIVNASSLQIGGLAANSYVEQVLSGGTFGINNLLPSSSSPQISIAVKNLSEGLQGLVVSSSGVACNTQLNMSGYNVSGVGQLLGQGAALVQTTTPSNNTVPNAIATTQYVETAISSIVPVSVPFTYGATASISWNQVTTGYFNGNYAPSNNGSYDQVQGGFATISFTVPKDPTVYPIVVTANMLGNIQYPTGGTGTNSATGPYQPFSGGSTPYGWNGLQMLWGYGCSVQAPILTGGFGVTVYAQTFFSAHLNTNSNVAVNNNPFNTVSFMVYQS